MSRAAGAAALGAVLIAAAAAFDTVSLYVPGVALAATALGSAVWVWLAAAGAALVRAPGPHTVEEEQPYPLRLELRAGVLPPPGGELTDPLLRAPIVLGFGAPRRVRVDVRFGRRGRRVLEPGALVIRDPLRLAVREIGGEGAGEDLLVLPRVEPVLAATSAGGAGGAGTGPDGGGGRAALRGRMDGSAAELDLDGLRPYRQGTPASRIHWPAVARSGEMLERRLTADADSAPLVVLDASNPPSEEALDMAVRAAASLCVHLARHGGCALLLPGDRRPTTLASELAAWPAAHARLALVGPARSAPPLTRARRAGAVIWVSTGGEAPRDLTARRCGRRLAREPVEPEPAAPSSPWPAVPEPALDGAAERSPTPDWRPGHERRSVARAAPVARGPRPLAPHRDGHGHPGGVIPGAAGGIRPSRHLCRRPLVPAGGRRVCGPHDCRGGRGHRARRVPDRPRAHRTPPAGGARGGARRCGRGRRARAGGHRAARPAPAPRRLGRARGGAGPGDGGHPDG